MELFTAGDESQLKIINRWIEESDVYMLLLGGRYGSIEPNSGKSYTQLEYEYAVKLKKPLFSLVISRDGLKDKIKKEALKDNPVEVSEIDNVDKFKKFQNSVGGHNKLIAPWTEYKDITISVFKCLTDIEWRYRDNLKGWVKADDTDYSSISEELARLSKENSELKGQLAIQDISVDKIVEYLKSKDVTIKYESGGYEINSLLDYFLSFAYDIQNRPSESNEETLHDFHLLQAHGLLEADSRKLSKKGNEVFSYIEVNNIDRNDFTKGYKNSSDELAKIVRGYMDRNRR